MPGRQASPAEYLRRLDWNNQIFGDDFRIIGVAFDKAQIEIVCSQPWITAHPERSVPTDEEIESYFARFGFLRVALNPDAPLFFHERLHLLVADAHDQNILRDREGELSPIDIVIGRPGPELLSEIRRQL